MKHKQSVWITGLFCLFLGAMALLTLLLPPKKFSELENRNLEPAPKLSAQSVSSGRFMKDAENWSSDHVVLRDRWVQLKALAERLSGKLENNGVCFAGEDTLLRLVEEPDETQVEKNISAVRGLIDKTDIPVRFGLIPTAASIWADRLPVGIPTLDETAWIDRLYREFGGSTQICRRRDPGGAGAGPPPGGGAAAQNRIGGFLRHGLLPGRRLVGKAR